MAAVTNKGKESVLDEVRARKRPGSVQQQIGGAVCQRGRAADCSGERKCAGATTLQPQPKQPAEDTDTVEIFGSPGSE